MVETPQSRDKIVILSQIVLCSPSILTESPECVCVLGYTLYMGTTHFSISSVVGKEDPQVRLVAIRIIRFTQPTV